MAQRIVIADLRTGDEVLDPNTGRVIYILLSDVTREGDWLVARVQFRPDMGIEDRYWEPAKGTVPLEVHRP